MPFYLFQHPSTQEVIEVKQKISDTHEYTDNEGVQWNRVFTIPYASVPNMTRVEAGSEQDFMKRTEGFDGTLGDLMDLSKDLSNKRVEERGDGTDNVKQKFFKDYSKDRNGLKHLDDKPAVDPKYKPNSDGVIEI
jgi:hypothetical protein